MCLIAGSGVYLGSYMISVSHHSPSYMLCCKRTCILSTQSRDLQGAQLGVTDDPAVNSNFVRAVRMPLFLSTSNLFSQHTIPVEDA